MKVGVGQQQGTRPWIPLPLPRVHLASYLQFELEEVHHATMRKPSVRGAMETTN